MVVDVLFAHVFRYVGFGDEVTVAEAITGE